MTQYMLSVHDDAGENTQALSPEDMESVFKAVDARNQTMTIRQAHGLGNGLAAKVGADNELR